MARITAKIRENREIHVRQNQGINSEVTDFQNLSPSDSAVIVK